MTTTCNMWSSTDLELKKNATEDIPRIIDNTGNRDYRDKYCVNVKFPGFKWVCSGDVREHPWS